MQGNVRLESSASRGRYSTLPVRPALRATRRHAWAETVLPESPASRNWGDKALPRRRHKEERLRSKGGMKSTSEGRRPPAAISGPRVSPVPFSDIRDPLVPGLRVLWRKTTGREHSACCFANPRFLQCRLFEDCGAGLRKSNVLSGYLNQPSSKSSPWTGRASLGPDLISSAGTPIRGSRSPARAHMR